MHILHLTPYYTPAYAFGGVVRAVEGMTRALVRCGHQVTVLTTDALDQSSRYDGPPDETLDGVRVVRVPNLSVRLRGRYNLSTPNKMRQAALEALPGVDVLHCHEFRTVENLLVTPAAKQRGIPLVLSPHGTLRLDTGRSRLKQWWDRILSPALAQRFDHVIGLTQAEIDDVQALWPSFGRRRIPATFSVIPNGIDPEVYTNLTGGDSFREKYGLGEGPVVLFMGRLHRRKGVDILARAFRQVAGDDARLVIVGPDEGMLATLQTLIDARVIITGYLDGADRLAALAAADIFALPAIGEGLSMAVLEALGTGLPVILSPECNLPEAEAVGAGLIVAPEVSVLAEALRTLLDDPDGRKGMGVAARQLIHERFTWDGVAVQLEKGYMQHIAL